MGSIALVLLGLFGFGMAGIAWKNPEPFYTRGRFALWGKLLGESRAKKFVKYVCVPFCILYGIAFVYFGLVG